MSEQTLPAVNYDQRLSGPNLFRSVFGERSDDEWREILLRSLTEPEIEGVPFPRFPDPELQSLIHGSSQETAIEDAFRFYRFVKSQVGEELLRPSARFLDFGSGWGRMLRPFLRCYDLNNIYAFEPNRLYLTIARSLNPHVNFLGGEPLPNNRIPRHTFDLIIGYSIFSHLSHHSTQLWLREMAELLRPGGCAVFTTWGRRFIGQLQAEKARQDAGEKIHWYHEFVLGKVGDPAALIDHYDSGRFIWAQVFDNPHYGETFLSRKALERILTDHALPLEVIAFDTIELPQDAFILRRL